MRIIIGSYSEGKLEPGFHGEGDEIPNSILQELKGRFTKEYRDANIALTEQQLLAAATPDQDIIQGVHALKNLDVTLNSMGKYTTEWYELHNPHEEVVWDELAQRGIDIPGLQELNAAVATTMQAREKLIARIEELMLQVMPNVTAVAGGLIGAKLLSEAGSIQRFATFPASTVQLLGAEEALFRHMKNRNSLPPKYGILFNHALVQKAQTRKRGKMARVLANAISLAAKVDHYKGEPIGEKLKAKVEVQARALARV